MTQLEGFDRLKAEVETELHPDLAAALVETETLGTWIKHPLYQGPFIMAATANACYEQKLRMVKECKAADDIQSLIFACHERPWRPRCLLDNADALSDEDYWTLVADVWIDTELPSQNWEIWDELLSSERPGREAMMQPEDHEIWDRFSKEPVLIYRGLSSDEDEVDTDGFAWTTHLPRAQWFAKRFVYNDRVPWLVYGEVMRDDVIAYFSRRSEHEVLVHPENVHVTKMEVL